jgi:hypothetical protein
MSYIILQANAVITTDIVRIAHANVTEAVKRDGISRCGRCK